VLEKTHPKIDTHLKEIKELKENLAAANSRLMDESEERNQL
jgi:hypothetical protein